MSFGALILPWSYPEAPWLYAHNIRTHAIPGSAQVVSSLNASTAITFTGVNGTTVQCWDAGWPGFAPTDNASAVMEEINWQEKSSAFKSFYCNYENKWLMIAGLMGGTASGGSGTIPSSGSFHKQGLFQNTVAGWGGYAATKYCRIDVTFRSLDWIPGDQGSLSTEFSSDIWATTHGQFNWGSGTYQTGQSGAPSSGAMTTGNPVDADITPGIPVNTIQFVRVLKNVPAIPLTQITAALNTVNSTTFYNLAPGYVAFDSADTFERAAGYNPQGSGYLWDISFRFKYRGIPWNAFLNPNGVWQQIVVAATGQPQWAPYDYNSLFASSSNQPFT